MTHRFVLDTNAWIDYFLYRSKQFDTMTQLIGRAVQSDNVTLCSTAKSTADVFYILECDFKKSVWEEQGSLSKEAARAANETAWACLETMRKLSFIVPADASDIIEATIFRSKHADYEDNLVAAAAKRMKATCVVTSDKELLKNQPYPCVTPVEALQMLA